MAKPIANVDITLETFADLVDRVNVIADTITNDVLTANATVANTGAPGNLKNVQLFGTLAGNTLIATNGIRGGNTSTSGNLTFTSNVSFTGNNTSFNSIVSYTANVTFSGVLFSSTSNTVITAANQQFKSNSTVTALAISGNSTSTTTTVSGTSFVVNTSSIILGGSGVSANGSLGSSGQVLYSNGSAAYWGSLSNVGITSVTAGNGLTGNITSNGVISVLANNGLIANSSGVRIAVGNTQLFTNSTGLFANQANFDHDSLNNYIANEHIDHTTVSINAGTGLTGGGTIAANRTLSVNAAYIATISSNNASLLGGQSPSYYTDILGRLGYTPLDVAGDSMVGKLTLPGSNSTFSPLRVTQGTAPSTPVNGDLWSTSAGLFARLGGVTRQFLTDGDISSFLAIAEMNISSDSGYIKFVNEFIWQWGKVTLGQDQGTTVNYTKTYTSWSLPMVSATSVYGNNGVDQNTGQAGYSLNSLNIWNASDEFHTIPWMVIGV